MRLQLLKTVSLSAYGTCFMHGSRGGGGKQRVWTCLITWKNIGFLTNTGKDPLKHHIPSLHSMLGHQRHASETPFKWRFTGGPMYARRFYWHLEHLIKKQKNNTTQSWTPSEKTFWIRACVCL